MEGEANIAERQAHFNDDGVIDKEEQKEIDKAHKRQLESRGRGPAQVSVTLLLFSEAYYGDTPLMPVCRSGRTGLPNGC